MDFDYTRPLPEYLADLDAKIAALRFEIAQCDSMSAVEREEAQLIQLEALAAKARYYLNDSARTLELHAYGYRVAMDRALTTDQWMSCEAQWRDCTDRAEALRAHLGAR